MTENKENLSSKVEKAFGAVRSDNNHAFSRDRRCVYCGRKLNQRNESCIQGIFRQEKERELMIECIERMSEIIEIYQEENTKLKNKEFGCPC